MRFLVELAAGFLFIAGLLTITAVGLAVYAGGEKLVDGWRRRREDRYMDRLLERAWDDPQLLWKHPAKGRRR